MTSILQHIDWLNGRVLDAVRAHLRQLVAVVGFLPHEQPLAVVTADAVLLAANRPFLDLLGTSSDEQLATVHDLGKITVPAEILSKPTRLSEAEFAIIRRHSEAGWELLEPAGLPASVTDAVLQHHERLDGSGYPGGLEDDDIGEFARIIAVADVVEAMSSHRPYRPAIGIEPALEEIERGRGVRYDERAADACLQLFRDEGFALHGVTGAGGDDRGGVVRAPQRP